MKKFVRIHSHQTYFSFVKSTILQLLHLSKKYESKSLKPVNIKKGGSKILIKEAVKHMLVVLNMEAHSEMEVLNKDAA